MNPSLTFVTNAIACEFSSRVHMVVNHVSRESQNIVQWHLFRKQDIYYATTTTWSESPYFDRIIALACKLPESF